MEKLRPLVFGAGAIGTYVGGSLALAGNPVVFVEQPAGVEELPICNVPPVILKLVNVFT